MRLGDDGENVFKINDDSVFLVENIKSDHEEADARIILHAKHAGNSYDRILMAIPDTKLIVSFVSLQNYIDGSIYFPTDMKNSRKIIDINAVGKSYVTS